MIDMIELGKNKDGDVSLDMVTASSSHIAISGRTGAGKSVAGQKIIRNIALREERPVIVFDMHHLFDEKNIFAEFREDIKKHSNDVKADETGISIPLFSPLKQRNGRMEDYLDVTTAITDVLASVMRLGIKQKECLLGAVEFVAEKNLYADYGISALDRVLNMVDDDRAATIQDRLKYVLKKNVFRDGPLFIKDKKVNIVRLSNFPGNTQTQIVEIILMQIWRIANTGKFMERGLTLFVDECQNLNWGKTGIVSTILCEGRKLGLQLILITQALGGPQKTELVRCMMQAGNQIYFAPPENETAIVAKMIGAKRYTYWQMRLKSLEVGECIVNGSLLVNKVPYNGALKVKI